MLNILSKSKEIRMTKRIGIIAMGLLLNLIHFSAHARYGHELSFSDLKSLIAQKKVTRIDDLIPLFPEEIRRNPLMVYDSHALNTYLVTPETPRVILFNKDASLIVAFTKNPGEKDIADGKDSIEIIHQNKNGQFEIGEMTFNGKETPALKLSGSEKCLRCHGTSPRPIFQDYNGWPGFYGSFGTKGVAVKGTTEFQLLKNFLTHRKSLARYKDLDLDFIQERELGFTTPVRGYGPLHDQVQFSTNLTFGAQIEALMHVRMGHLLKSHDDFPGVESVFYYLGERSNRCGPIRERTKKAYAALIDRAHGEYDATNISSLIITQVFKDYFFKQEELLKFNAPDLRVDPRGLLNIPFENFSRGYATDVQMDPTAFKDQLVLIETLMRHLNLSEMHISTTPGHPTSGIYHLTRLGRLLIDEQYFQNLIGGIAIANPGFLRKHDAIPCDEVSEKALSALKRIAIPDPNLPGVLYK